MSGCELRKIAESAGLSPMEVCQAAGIKSLSTLYKVYKDIHVRTTNRARVEQAIKRLAAKAKGDVAVAG